MAKRILVVDDDPDLRQAAEIILASAGYETISASSAAEARQRVAANPPDLILLDVMMETHTEGFHFVYELRQDEKLKGIPVVMLTSIEERTGQELPVEEAGDFLPVQGFLRKPVDAAALKAKVAQLLK